MRKILCLILCLNLLLVCCSCNKNDNLESNASSSSVLEKQEAEKNKIQDKSVSNKESDEDVITPNPDYLLKCKTYYGPTYVGDTRTFKPEYKEEYTYDSMGRLKTYVISFFTGKKNKSIGTYSDYDERGNPQKLMFTDGSYNTYTYNSNNKTKIEFQYDHGNVYKKQYEYDKYGRQILQKCSDSVNGKTYEREYRYEYESNEICYKYSGKNKDKYIIEHDLNNNIIKETSYTQSLTSNALEIAGYTTFEYVLKNSIIKNNTVSMSNDVRNEENDKSQLQKIKKNECSEESKSNNSDVVDKNNIEIEDDIRVSDEDKYIEAKKSFDMYLTSFSTQTYSDIDKLYHNALNLLNGCSGYGDCSKLIKIAERLRSAIDDIQRYSNSGATFYQMNVSVDNYIVTIKKSRFITHTESDVTVIWDSVNDTFTCNIFNIGMPTTRTKQIEGLMKIFSNIGDVSNIWDVGEWSESNKISYYNANISEYSVRIEFDESASKGNIVILVKK